MKNRSLFIIAGIASLVGLFVLAVIRPDVSPSVVQIEGIVERVDVRGSVSFIRFSPKNFTVVSFETDEFAEGEQVLYGRLQNYKGRVEFIVESSSRNRVGR